PTSSSDKPFSNSTRTLDAQLQIKFCQSVQINHADAAAWRGVGQQFGVLVCLPTVTRRGGSSGLPPPREAKRHDSRKACAGREWSPGLLAEQEARPRHHGLRAKKVDRWPRRRLLLLVAGHVPPKSIGRAAPPRAAPASDFRRVYWAAPMVAQAPTAARLAGFRRETKQGQGSATPPRNTHRAAQQGRVASCRCPLHGRHAPGVRPCVCRPSPARRVCHLLCFLCSGCPEAPLSCSASRVPCCFLGRPPAPGPGSCNCCLLSLTCNAVVGPRPVPS
ncbi:unnamed protein product, partial [Amoebophrya sp. A120]